MARRARKPSRARANVARARARSRAAVRGWKTRRENALRRSLAAKKAARTRKRRAFKLTRERDIKPKKRTRRAPRPEPGERVDFLVSFQFSAGKKSYRRDLIVPASRGSSPASIIAQAKKELPRGADTLAPFLTAKNATIFEGPSTSRKRTEMR